MDTVLTTSDVFAYLQITVAVLLVVVLYHVLFIVVDLRKVLRRIEAVTKEVENVIMKPIGMADQVLQAIMSFLEEQQKAADKKKKSSSKQSK